MNLEEVEQHCLRYLEQSKNPLVSVNTLLAHLWTNEQFADVTEQDLLAFLRRHELVLVIDSPATSEAEQVMAEADFSQGPYAILRTRIPTKSEMSALILEQLDQMTAALTGALREAVSQGDKENQQTVAELLEKTQKFRDKLEKMF